MDDSERALLRSAHEQIVDCNRQCVARVSAAIPNADIVLNPYSRLRELRPFADTEQQLLPSNNLREMAKAFQSHSAITVACGAPAAVRSLTAAEYLQRSLALESRLRAKGPQHGDDDLHSFALTAPVDPPARSLLRIICALVILRASLAVLNQMIYQAVVLDGLPLLDEDNVFAVLFCGSHLSGRALSLAVQPDWNALFLKSGDVVLVKAPNPPVIMQGLAQIQSTRTTISADVGMRDDIDMRMLTDELNPYGMILTQL